MKYKYVKCNQLEDYSKWEIIQIIPKISADGFNMAVIKYEDKPIQKETYLSEATNEELINELNKRLKDSDEE